jgi:hypothetical protein
VKQRSINVRKYISIRVITPTAKSAQVGPADLHKFRCRLYSPESWLLGKEPNCQRVPGKVVGHDLTISWILQLNGSILHTARPLILVSQYNPLQIRSLGHQRSGRDVNSWQPGRSRQVSDSKLTARARRYHVL